MPLKKRALSTSLCIAIALSFLVSALFIPVTVSQPSGETKFYFKDILDIEDLEYDSSGSFALLSQVPPTKENTSSYPPLLIEDISLKNGISLVDNETAIEWFSLWAVRLLEEYEDYGDLLDGFEGFDELWDQLKLFFPDPLRIVECYEYQGNESIQLNGNIDYDLYFKTKLSSQIHKNDQVKLSVYTFSETAFIPTEIGNTTFVLRPGYLQKTIQQSVTITNISKTIHPNQLVLFSVELLPGNKTITSFLAQENAFLQNVSKLFIKSVRAVANLSGISEVEDIITIINEFNSLIEEEGSGINITKQDIADVLESLTSFSFLYDSSDYPSSVTVPFKAADDTDDSSFTYYLHDNGNMDSTRPTAASQQVVNLAESTGSWTAPQISRNKILSDASAIVYINHKDLQKWSPKMAVQAALTYGNTTLDKDTITLDRTNLLSTSLKPYRFSFDDIGSGIELTYGKKIGLRLSLENTTSVNNLFRTVQIYFDSSDYASMLSFYLSETDHIQASGSRSPNDGKIIVGDTVTYTIDISSDLQDTISLSIQEKTFSADEQEFWDVSISPESFSIEENGNKTVIVTLTSLGTTLAAYDQDPLDIILDIIGNTGYDTIQLSSEVSDDAVTYDTIITSPSDRKIVHGTNETFIFTIENNNTGLWRDSYIFSADIDKNLSIEVFPLTFDHLDVGNQTNVTVNVSIPKNTNIKEATITFTIKSKRSGIEQESTVNITIIGANIIESAFDYFEELSDSLGLTDIFGDYAPIVLVSIIFIVVFFILILMAFILTTKYVDVICVDRIKEINPENSATYELILKNVTNKTRTYYIHSDLSQKSPSWNISFSSDKLTIPAKQQGTISALVTASDDVKPGDWSEFNLKVTTEGKSKEEKIPLFCSLSDGTVSLSIKNVFHWPKSFSSDQKISTSFRLHNSGNVQARNVSVKLFINNKEKNKVEELIIPAGGYADITLPWIAEKGKNDLRIMVS